MTQPSLPSFDVYSARMLAAGFDEVIERRWGPDATADTHTHPFSVEALVVEGEFWLQCGGLTRHLRPGDTFELPRDTPHAERYGPEGAAFWAARRNAPPA